MGNVTTKPVIAKAILLDRRERSETGRVLYVFLILERDGKTVLDRPATARTLREIVAIVIAYRREHYGMPRVSFDAPKDVDREAGKFPRRYDALDLSEIYYASSALGQS